MASKEVLETIKQCARPVPSDPVYVAGLEDAKRCFAETRRELKHAELFQGTARGEGGRAVLFFGPPGNGKTLLARRAAQVLGAKTIYEVSASDLTSRFFGESESLVKELFRAGSARAADESAPVVIFIDEVDTLARERGGANEDGSERRVLGELLVGMTAADDRVVVIGATNRPADLDSAFRRRFGRRLHVGLPSPAARSALIRHALAGISPPHTVGVEALAAAVRVLLSRQV